MAPRKTARRVSRSERIPRSAGPRSDILKPHNREDKRMEARVDVRKLQILNDRINQTIDALNQVRLSVHGLGHTGMNLPGYGMQQGLGAQNPYLFGAPSPYQSLHGFGGQLSQLSSQLGQQGFPGAGMGFQHSPFVPYPNPYVNPFAAQAFGAQPWTIPQAGITGTPWVGLGGGTGGFQAGGIGGGLFHSNPELIDKQIAEVKASDPYRITQTFPFVIP